LPFGATFLIFSDCMRPPIRLAALMGLHVIYVFTHDSIALGQDGSTHQPVEQLASLRAVPGLTVIRPGDANETAVAWRVALEAGDHPVALVLTRQNVPTLDRTQFATADGLRHGAYVLVDAPNGRPDAILIASGSEVGLIMAARQTLQDQKVPARVVFHAELGIVRRSAAELSRPGVVAVNPWATSRRSGCIAGLASLRRRSR
jgi:transketolase